MPSKEYTEKWKHNKLFTDKTLHTEGCLLNQDEIAKLWKEIDKLKAAYAKLSKQKEAS